MTDGPTGYSPDEVRDILERATERAPGSALVPVDDRLSLAELQEAAREAGIDPAAVRSAALATLPARSGSVAARLVGGPARRRHRLFVPGHLPSERRREVAAALEAVLDGAVATEDGGGYVVWEEDHRQGWTRISAREVDGGLEIDVVGDRRGWVTLAGVASAAVVSALTVAAVGLAPALLQAPLVVAAGALAAFVLGIRAVWGPRSRRLHRTLERALGEVVARIEAPADATDAEGAS